MRIYSWATLILAAIAGITLTSDSAVFAQTASRERTLFVSAVDAKGEPVEGLGPDAFVVREDGRRREVLRVSRATEPMDLALLVDNSQAATDDITFIREALSKFVAGMGKEHRIALIGLAERPTVLVPYTTDRTQLATAIGRLFFMTGSGMTLMDALFETSRGLRSRDSERAVFVPVLTDGVEFTNRYSKDVVRELRDAGVAMHAVGIGRFPYADEHSIRERAFVLDDGPKVTGGQRITLLTPNALPAAMERLARELSAQYKVVYARPESLYEWNVEVTSGRPGLTVRGTPARQSGAGK
jgi:VWFA-related protein